MNNKVKSGLIIAFLLGTAGLIQIVYAQQDETATQDSRSTKDKAVIVKNVGDTTKPDSNKKSKPNVKVFKPSEKISEDVPVDFPVDI